MTLPPPSHAASEDQIEALRAFDSFLTNRDDRVFVLSGAAGTGKTSLLGRMMQTVASLHRRGHLAGQQRVQHLSGAPEHLFYLS